MYPRSGGTGENTPFAEQSKEKEWDKCHKSCFVNTAPEATPKSTPC